MKELEQLILDVLEKHYHGRNFIEHAAYIKFKDHYSRDEIDNMLWCEIEELLANEETDEK